MSRTYYFIDYRATIDAIKWRVYKLNKIVQGNTVPEEERKDFFCARCKSEWTTMEVLDAAVAAGFECHKCHWILDPITDENTRGGHEQSTKYHAQFRFITELLPKIDEVVIPENNFDKAYANQKAVIRDETNPANETTPVDIGVFRPTAVKGMNMSGPKSIAITLTTQEGPTEAEAAAELARREKVAAQNAMPVHFTHSTISGEQVKFNPASQLPIYSSNGDDKKSALDTPSVNGDGAEIDEYFARLKAEQAREAAAEQEEEEETDDDEEDEDGFEDVVPTATGSGAGTPISASAPFANGITSILKKRPSESGSGTSTGVPSPVTGPGTPSSSDGRSAKRVKIEEPVEAASAVKDEEESEEDMEFEDV